MQNSLKLLLILSLFASCSGGKINWGGEPPELTESFEMEEDTRQRFIAKPIPPKQLEAAQPKEVVVEKKVRPKKSKKNKIVLTKKKIVEKKPAQKDKPKEKQKVVTYPENYPSKYKDWDKDNKKLWSNFNLNSPVGELTSLRIRYLGIPVGTLKLSVSGMVELDSKKALHLTAKLKTDSYYSMLYQLDETLDSYVEMEGFLPLKYALIRREKKKDVDDLQLFDRTKMTIFHFYKKVVKGGKTHNKKQEIPMPKFVQDPLSSIIFLRGLPLKNGDDYTFPVGNKSKLYLSRAQVVGREVVKVLGENVRAIKVSATNSLSGKKKKGKMIFWFADDGIRRLLKMSGDIKIGHIEGELVDYKR